MLSDFMYTIRNASPSSLSSTLVATPIMQNMKIVIAAAAMLDSLLLMDVVIGIPLHASPCFRSPADVTRALILVTSIEKNRNSHPLINYARLFASC